MAFVNLGLTTDQWDNEWPFAAPMQAGAPWSGYTRTGHTIPAYALPSTVLQSWKVINRGDKGFWAQRGCYCWGHRPAIARPSLGGLGGLGGGQWDGGTIDPATGEPWWICADACPPDVCPTCPSYAPPAPCPPQTVCPPQAPQADCPDVMACPTKAEINIWWIAGAAMLGIAGGRWWKQRR